MTLSRSELWKGQKDRWRIYDPHTGVRARLIWTWQSAHRLPRSLAPIDLCVIAGTSRP
jgi:hypothetical protein